MADPFIEVKNPSEVLKIVREFIDTMKITDADVLYDEDRILDEAPEFFNELCNAAGWADPDEEEIIDLDYDEDNPEWD